MVLWLSHARWHLLCHSNIIFYIFRLFYYVSIENKFFNHELVGCVHSLVAINIFLKSKVFFFLAKKVH
jgi:hypothetical protein